MGDLRNYPEGRGALQSRYINNVLVEFGVTKQLRTRVSPTQLAAGLALLPALPGVRWRLVDAKQIAVGGAATTSTSCNLQGAVAGVATQLLATAVAALTQSAVVRAGATNAVVLADGASFVQQDANTAMTAKTVGGTLTVATFIDYFIEYVADPA